MKYSNHLDPDIYIAAQLITQLQKVSLSLLQRRLRITYNIAKKLLDQLQQLNLIRKTQPKDNPFEVLVSYEKLNSYLLKIEIERSIKIPIRGRNFTQ